ncbi:Origin recognition complex subunit 3 [Umbelopsis sp. WA50703]
MEQFDSISEGCFLVMPKSGARGRPSLKKRKRSYKAINATNLQSSKVRLGNAGFQRLFTGDESEGAMQIRMDGYDSSWRYMKGLLDVSRDHYQKLMAPSNQWLSGYPC